MKHNYISCLLTVAGGIMALHYKTIVVVARLLSVWGHQKRERQRHLNPQCQYLVNECLLYSDISD